MAGFESPKDASASTFLPPTMAAVNPQSEAGATSDLMEAFSDQGGVNSHAKMTEEGSNVEGRPKADVMGEFMENFVEANLNENMQYKANWNLERKLPQMEDTSAMEINSAEAPWNVTNSDSQNDDKLGKEDSSTVKESDAEGLESSDNTENPGSLTLVDTAPRDHEQMASQARLQSSAQNDSDAMSDAKTYPFNPDAKVFVPKAMSNKNLVSVMAYSPQVHDTVLHSAATAAPASASISSSPFPEASATDSLNPVIGPINVMDEEAPTVSNPNMLVTGQGGSTASAPTQPKLFCNGPARKAFPVAALSSIDPSFGGPTIRPFNSETNLLTGTIGMSSMTSFTNVNAANNITASNPTSSMFLSSVSNNLSTANSSPPESFSALSLSNEIGSNTSMIPSNGNSSDAAAIPNGSFSSTPKNVLRSNPRINSGNYPPAAGGRPPKPRFAGSPMKFPDTVAFPSNVSDISYASVINTNSGANDMKANATSKLAAVSPSADLASQSMHFAPPAGIQAATQNFSQSMPSSFSQSMVNNPMQPFPQQTLQTMQQAMRQALSKQGAASMRPPMSHLGQQQHQTMMHSSQMPHVSMRKHGSMQQHRPMQQIMQNLIMQQQNTQPQAMQQQPHKHAKATQMQQQQLHQASQQPQGGLSRNAPANEYGSTVKGSLNDTDLVELTKYLCKDLNANKEGNSSDPVNKVMAALRDLNKDKFGFAKDRSSSALNAFATNNENNNYREMDIMKATLGPHSNPFDTLPVDTYAAWEKLEFSGQNKSLGEGFPVLECNSQLYAFGNKVSAGTASELFVYDSSEGKHRWNRVNVRNPQIRGSVEIVSAMDKLYLFSRLSEGSTIPNVWEFDPTECKWTVHEYAPQKQFPLKRQDYSIVSCGGFIYVFGGIYNKDWLFLNDLWCLNLHEIRWEKLCEQTAHDLDDPKGEAVNFPCARAGHSSIAYDKSLYIFGGIGGDQELGDLFEYNTVSLLWKRISPSGTLPAPRYGHSASIIGDRMIIFGGYGAHRSFLSDLHELNFSRMTWTRVVTKGRVAPSPRFRHYSATLNDYLYIFSGRGSPKHLPDSFAKSNEVNNGDKVRIAVFTDSFRICMNRGYECEQEKGSAMRNFGAEMPHSDEIPSSTARSGEITSQETASRESDINAVPLDTASLHSNIPIGSQGAIGGWRKRLENVKLKLDGEVDELSYYRFLASELWKELLHEQAERQQLIQMRDAEKQELNMIIQNLQQQLYELKNSSAQFYQSKPGGHFRAPDANDDGQRRFRDQQQMPLRDWPVFRNKYGGSTKFDSTVTAPNSVNNLPNAMNNPGGVSGINTMIGNPAGLNNSGTGGTSAQLVRGYNANDNAGSASTPNSSLPSRLNTGYSDWASLVSDAKSMTNNATSNMGNNIPSNFVKRPAAVSNTNAGQAPPGTGFGTSLFANTNAAIGSLDALGYNEKSEMPSDLSNEAPRKLPEAGGMYQAGERSTSSAAVTPEDGCAANIDLSADQKASDIRAFMKMLSNVSSKGAGTSSGAYAKATSGAAAPDRHGQSFGPIGPSGAGVSRYSPWNGGNVSHNVSSFSGGSTHNMGFPNNSNSMKDVQGREFLNLISGQGYNQGSNTAGFGAIGSFITQSASLATGNATSAIGNNLVQDAPRKSGHGVSLPGNQTSHTFPPGFSFGGDFGEHPQGGTNPTWNREHLDMDLVRSMLSKAVNSVPPNSDASNGGGNVNQASQMFSMQQNQMADNKQLFVKSIESTAKQQMVSPMSSMTPNTSFATRYNLENAFDFVNGNDLTSAVPTAIPATATTNTPKGIASSSSGSAAPVQLNFTEMYKDKTNPKDMDWNMPPGVNPEYPPWT